jgi:hypothetical protein
VVSLNLPLHFIDPVERLQLEQPALGRRANVLFAGRQ